MHSAGSGRRWSWKIGKAPESKGVEAGLRKSCPTANGKS